MQEDIIQTGVDGAIFHLLLNRPAHYNAMDSDLLERLPQVLDLAADPRYRVVAITGAGKAFCAGGDVSQFATFLAGTRVPREMPDNLHRGIKKIRSLGKPVVALVNGACAGAGFSLSLACDYTIATASAKFTIAYSGIGLSPDGGSTYFLPRMIGFKRAMAMFLTNQTLSAREAFELGVINEVSEDPDFGARSQELLARLAAGPTAAFAKAKDLVNRSFEARLDEQLERETEAICQSGLSPDFREGIMSFVEKRKPRFSGI